MSESEIGLKDLVRKVREDLISLSEEAEQSEEGEVLLFERVIIETQVIAERSEMAGGGFDLKVLSGKGELRDKDAQVHRVTVEFSSFGERAAFGIIEEE